MSEHTQSTSTSASKLSQRIPWPAVLAIVVAVSTAFYVRGVHPNLFPKNFGVVDEAKLYRSGSLTPAATRLVAERHKIKTIVDLGAYDKHPEREVIAQRTADALGIERHVFPLEGDGTGNPNAYVQALRIINDPSKQPVLVHCAAGAQRTSGCVMLYRDFVQGKPLDATYAEAQDFKHDPKDNPKLLPFLKQWHDQIGSAFKSGTLIPGQPESKPIAPEATR